MTRVRHASGSSSRRSTPSISMLPVLRVVEAAQQLGERRLARAVDADDRHRGARGDREVEALEHGGQVGPVRERHVAEADLARGHARRPGFGVAGDRQRAGLRPCAGSSRLSATTGAAAPSSAQLQPPNAIIDVPTMRGEEHGRAVEGEVAVGGRVGDRPRDEHVRARARAAGCSRAAARAAASTSTAARRGGARRDVKRSITQSESPNSRTSLAAGGVDREPVRVLGVALRGAHLVGVAVLPHRALAQEVVRRDPRADEHGRRPPRVAEQQQARREAADHLDEPARDEVHADRQRRSGDAEVEVAGDGEVGDEVGVLEVRDAERRGGRGHEPVVEIRRGPAAEVGADREVQRREHLEEHEHDADRGERPGERAAGSRRRRSASRSRPRSARAAGPATRAAPTRRSRGRARRGRARRRTGIPGEPAASASRRG